MEAQTARRQTETSESVITLTNVSKYYRLYRSPQERLKEALHPFGKQYHRKFYASKGMNLEIKKGEIVGIVGRNGSGKSTLLKLVSGVLTPDAGEISVRGKLIALLELGSGFNPEFTGRQNIFFYGTILGFGRDEMHARLDEIIAFADIGEFMDQPLKTYSSGMKARLGFAVAAHIDPEILILDEVLSVGDELFRRKCHAKMESFFKAGKTILYVSHNANSINDLCTRAILLNGGEILLDGDAKTVTAYYQKLLFAQKDSMDNIIDEAKAQQQRMAKSPAMPDNTEKSAVSDTKSEKVQSYFIPGLVPQSSVVIDNLGAVISDPAIHDEDGNRVNALVRNRRYRYSFRVSFTTGLTQVSFSAQIKTEKGVRISQKSMSRSGEYLESVRPGETYLVDWYFDCILLPGNYYIDCSTTGSDASGKEGMSQIKDVAVFKVVGSKRFAETGGLVTLNQHIGYRQVKL